MNNYLAKMLSEKSYSPSLINLMDKYSFHKIIWGKGEYNKEGIPKIIWLYWSVMNNSPLVDICIRQIKELHPEYEINILNEQNIKYFLSDIPDQRQDLPLANYTDLIRLKLLEKYGGFWLDASILLSENLDWIHHLKQNDSTDIVGFYSEFFTSDWEFPLLENWFLAAPPHNKFIIAWTTEFEKCYTSDNPHQYYEKEKQSPYFLQKIDGFLGNYLIAYLAASKVMRNCQDFRLNMISANDIGHYYNFGQQLKPHHLQEIFLFQTKNQHKYIPLIKFEKKGRNAIDEALNRGHYSKESLLFRIAPQPNYYSQKIPKLWKYYLYLCKNIIKKLCKNIKSFL